MKSCIYWMRQTLDEDCLRPDLVVYHDANGWFKTDHGFREYQANALIAAGAAGTSAENWFVPDLEPLEVGNSSIGEWGRYGSVLHADSALHVQSGCHVTAGPAAGQ